MEKKHIEPGVSGKTITGKNWFNSDKYHEQLDQLHKDDEAEKGFAQSTGQNLIGRTDLKNQGEQSGSVEEKAIFEALKRGPGVDVAKVRVSVNQGVVTLQGTAADTREARAIVNIVENISGVEKVVNNLEVSDPESHLDQ